jgi:hypothetical protein
MDNELSFIEDAYTERQLSENDDIGRAEARSNTRSRLQKTSEHLDEENLFDAEIDEDLGW